MDEFGTRSSVPSSHFDSALWTTYFQPFQLHIATTDGRVEMFIPQRIYTRSLLVETTLKTDGSDPLEGPIEVCRGG